MTKLKDTGLLPKKKEMTVEKTRARELYNNMPKDWWAKKIWNACIDLCGEIEVLERLDEIKIAHLLAETSYTEWGNYTPQDLKLAQAICQKFGTSKEE
ncbi:MAG TPA: hypothetical protein ENI23_05310 [bacterium]|nr:hypothetical protein [bacterium]